jgi:hypothetical protein
MSDDGLRQIDGEDHMRKSNHMLTMCRAHSQRTGEACKKTAIPGGTVCRYHGGGAKQVQNAARERLAALVMPALGALSELVKQRKVPAVRLGAARDVLDRSELARIIRQEFTGADGGPIQVQDLSRYTDEELRQLRAIQEAALARQGKK